VRVVSPISDVIKVWVWTLGSLVVGLYFTLIAYNGGKALAELSETKDFSSMINDIATWSGAADLKDFFMICWPTAAALLLVPMIEWLRRENGEREHKLRSVCLASRRGPLQAITGFLMTFGCFVLIGYAMVKAGPFTWAADAGKWRENLFFDIGWTLLIATIIQLLFSCVMLGIFVRAMKIPAAIALTAMMFAGIQFLMVGFTEAEAFDSESLSTIHLTGILFFGGEPITRFVVVFLPWFAFGCVLGWARWRTASIWLPTGLLMGWLLADRLFKKATDAIEIPNSVVGYLSAGSVQTGIIPLIGVLAIACIVYLLIQAHASEQQAHD